MSRVGSRPIGPSDSHERSIGDSYRGLLKMRDVISEPHTVWRKGWVVEAGEGGGGVSLATEV